MIENVLGNKNDSGKYIGYLMCDGYAGYNVFSGKRLACWAHVRRKFFNIASDNANAKNVLKLINKLYKIERRLSKEKDENKWSNEDFYKHRHSARNMESKKIIKQIKDKLLLYGNKSSPSSSLGKAISYAKNRWFELQVYLEDGCLPIDNNAAERSIRSMVVGRKNWLFAGSEDAGQWAANCYSIMESCRLQGIDPRSYMNIVTKVLIENKNNENFDYSSLTPKMIAEKIKDVRRMMKNL